MTQVVVVDDDRSIRDLLRYALEAEGYAVALQCDGRRVVETLRGLAEPCVVLMDLMMPGVTGWEVCEALLAEPALARHPLIVMTAAYLPGDPYPAPARALLRKPFTLDQVYQLVETLASEAAVHDALLGAPTIYERPTAPHAALR